jgi:hypothetical protein
VHRNVDPGQLGRRRVFDHERRVFHADHVGGGAAFRDPVE